MSGDHVKNETYNETHSIFSYKQDKKVPSYLFAIAVGNIAYK